MATINGTSLVVAVGGTALAAAKECDLDISNAGRDTTTKDSAGWATSAADGKRSWKVSCKGLVDFSSSYNVSSLFSSFTNRTTVTVTFGALTGSGLKMYSGTAVIKDLKMGAPVEESATFDAEFEGTGALTEASHT